MLIDPRLPCWQAQPCTKYWSPPNEAPSMTPVTGPACEFWPTAELAGGGQNRIVSNATGNRDAFILSELLSIETRLKRTHMHLPIVALNEPGEIIGCVVSWR